MCFLSNLLKPQTREVGSSEIIGTENRQTLRKTGLVYVLSTKLNRAGQVYYFERAFWHGHGPPITPTNLPYGVGGMEGLDHSKKYRY